ncbi:zinc finger protein 628-like isoform X2 [Limulus polyphemus]|uniref:Zinc finger protein 628-like isoform X2 n=1 Tax=Limulus polyphemus TaxID=6850 RepID=A0ABM1T2T0_LIMPO|nr:zinc finger protein 628-like isoform X2 [Limulus polyphemus]
MTELTMNALTVTATFHTKETCGTTRNMFVNTECLKVEENEIFRTISSDIRQINHESWTCRPNSTSAAVCQICGKFFKAKQNLRQHMQIHGQKFQCINCQATFKFRSNLFRHQRRFCPFRVQEKS